MTESTPLLLVALLGAAQSAPPAKSADSVQAAPMIPVAPTVERLLGRGEAEIRERLGEPEIARAEEVGAMWTYRRPTCALHVFFRREGERGALRVSGVSSGPLKPGAAAPDVNACLAYGDVR